MQDEKDNWYYTAVRCLEDAKPSERMALAEALVEKIKRRGLPEVAE